MESFGERVPDDLPLGATRLSLSPCVSPVRRAASIRSTSIHQLTIVTIRTGIINPDYLKKRWLWGGPSCSVAGALGGGADEAQTFGLQLQEAIWALSARHLFSVSHSKHISYRHEHWRKYRCSSVSKLNTKLDILPRCGQKFKTGFESIHTLLLFSRHTSYSQLCG